MTTAGRDVWKIRGRAGEFLVARRGNGEARTGFFLDPLTLASDLDHHSQNDPRGIYDLQEMLLEVDLTVMPGAGELYRSDSRRIIRNRLLQAFAREELVVLTELPRPVPVASDPASEEPPPKPKPVPAPPPKPVAAKTWVALRLINEGGKPCAKERFKVTLPDGAVWEGKLDAAGEARKDGIVDGPCKVTFPDLGPATGKS